MPLRITMFAFLSTTVLAVLNLALLPMPASAATYYVDGQSPDASDDHPGAAEALGRPFPVRRRPRNFARGIRSSFRPECIANMWK